MAPAEEAGRAWMRSRNRGNRIAERSDKIRFQRDDGLRFVEAMLGKSLLANSSRWPGGLDGRPRAPMVRRAETARSWPKRATSALRVGESTAGVTSAMPLCWLLAS